MADLEKIRQAQVYAAEFQVIKELYKKGLMDEKEYLEIKTAYIENI